MSNGESRLPRLPGLYFIGKSRSLTASDDGGAIRIPYVDEKSSADQEA